MYHLLHVDAWSPPCREWRVAEVYNFETWTFEPKIRTASSRGLLAGTLLVRRAQELFAVQVKTLDGAILPELEVTIGATMCQNLTLVLQKIL